MLFEMINQEFEAQGKNYQMLPSFGVCYRELGGSQSYEFLCMHVQFLLCHMVS